MLARESGGLFTGRDWLVPRIWDWLDHTDEPLMVITGAPGTGKSALVDWLAGRRTSATAGEGLERLRHRIVAIHACVAGSGSIAPRAFAENVARQLTASTPTFAAALAATLADRVTIVGNVAVTTVEAGASVNAVVISKLDLSGLGHASTVDRGLREPLRRMYEDGESAPIVVLIDGLDEAATFPENPNIARILGGLTDLPRPVRFLATTRPDPRVLKYFRDVPTIDLVRDAPPEADDLTTYVAARLAETTWPAGAADCAQRAAAISRAADGVFLYAQLVLNAPVDGTDLLPAVGLAGHYPGG